MKPISGHTKLCGVIGDPIEHTMSPAMHNAAFENLGLDYRYVAFHVKKERLGEVAAGMKALGIKGLNVTVPHKVDIMSFLDELDPLAKKIGAINTIVNNDGILQGYNTDAGGFLQTLLEKGVEPRGRSVVVVGAGGVARAITFALADRGATLSILNRRQEMNWALSLAKNISEAFGMEVKALELNNQNLSDVLKNAEILVNATSVGMTPNDNETPVPADLLKPGMVVFDVVYNPYETRLLKEAKSAGAQPVSGLDMLVWQGALAFEKFTGAKPPVNIMKDAAYKAIFGDER